LAEAQQFRPIELDALICRFHGAIFYQFATPIVKREERISGYGFLTSFDANLPTYHRSSGLRFQIALGTLDLIKAQQFAPIELDALICNFHEGRFFSICRTMSTKNSVNFQTRR
jgi:hypothetical protein